MCSERQIHRCGDEERRILEFRSGGRLIIMTFMEIILGKEENIREKKRSIVVVGKRLFC